MGAGAVIGSKHEWFLDVFNNQDLVLADCFLSGAAKELWSF